MPRKKNHAPIDPALVEELTGQGFTVFELADYFDKSREIFHRDPALKQAIARGLVANQARKQRLVEPPAAFDAGRQLFSLLTELQTDFATIREELTGKELTA